MSAGEEAQKEEEDDDEKELGDLAADVERLRVREGITPLAGGPPRGAPDERTANEDVYERLTAMIGELPVLTATDAWRDRVREALDQEESREREERERQAPSRTAAAASDNTPRRRFPIRRAAIVTSLSAAAAALMLWFFVHKPAPTLALPPQLSLELRHGQTLHRALETAVLGDQLLVRGTSATELRIYLDGRTLVASCPGAARCSYSEASAVLEVELAAPGKYRAILLHGAGAPPTPSGEMEIDLRAAQAAGFTVTTALPLEVR